MPTACAMHADFSSPTRIPTANHNNRTLCSNQIKSKFLSISSRRNANENNHRHTIALTPKSLQRGGVSFVLNSLVLPLAICRCLYVCALWPLRLAEMTNNVDALAEKQQISLRCSKEKWST